MSSLELAYPGYVCAPYMHTHESVELKEHWMRSSNIESMFFVTGTFSVEIKPYFSDSVNHYLLAKFKNSQFISDDLSDYNQAKRTFVFNIKDDLFERDVDGETNFISVYYLEYGGDGEDAQEIALLLLKREKISKVGLGNMRTFSLLPSRFTFPYSENIVVIEVASEKSHQSVKKYCEQTRRDVNRKGLTMTNMMSLSILDCLK